MRIARALSGEQASQLNDEPLSPDYGDSIYINTMPIYNVNYYKNAEKLSSLRIFAKSTRGACSKASRMEIPRDATCIFVHDPLNNDRRKRYYEDGSPLSMWLNAEDV